MNDMEWDETNYPRKVANKAIDTSFLRDMSGDFCMAPYTDGWGRTHHCDRLPGHTGRHLVLERLGRYPVAVWR